MENACEDCNQCIWNSEAGCRSFYCEPVTREEALQFMHDAEAKEGGLSNV